jgi:hypothetical protein
MTDQTANMSLRFKGRIAGALYLMIIAGGLFAVGYVPAAVGINGDTVATAHNILAQETLYRFGLAIHLIIALCNIPLAAIFYDVFKVVSESFARIIVFFILVAVGIESVNLLNQFVPLVLLTGDRYSSVVIAEQLQAQAYMPLELQDIGFNISLAFVGCYCLVAGSLIVRSRILPRLVGVMLAIAGAAYVVNCFISIVSPGFAAGLFPYIQLPSFIGEASLCLALLIKGINVDGWNKRDGVQRISVIAASS